MMNVFLAEDGQHNLQHRYQLWTSTGDRYWWVEALALYNTLKVL